MDLPGKDLTDQPGEELFDVLSLTRERVRVRVSPPAQAPRIKIALLRRCVCVRAAQFDDIPERTSASNCRTTPAKELEPGAAAKKHLHI